MDKGKFWRISAAVVLVSCFICLVGVFVEWRYFYARRDMNTKEIEDFDKFIVELRELKPHELVERDDGFYEAFTSGTSVWPRLRGPAPLSKESKSWNYLPCATSDNYARKMFGHHIRFIHFDDPEWESLSQKYFPRKGK